MNNDRFVDGEAMSGVDGVDVTHLLGNDPAQAAFNAYRVAFRANEAEPKLRNAAALVKAWNRFADVMRIDRV